MAAPAGGRYAWSLEVASWNEVSSLKWGRSGKRQGDREAESDMGGGALDGERDANEAESLWRK